MDWMYLVYFLLGLLVFFGARLACRNEWNEDYTSLKQTKVLQGITALFIALHHMAQKTCAPWHPTRYTVHGLDVFVPLGYLFVGVFLFCSGLGLYRSLHSKPDYLKGFFRRRILPIVIAFYLSEIIYTAVRLLMGEKMDALTVAWYLSGLHMANFNAWYVIVIPFFYLAFWAAFRFCKREGTAVFLVFLFTLGYTVLGTAIDQQNDWWMRGEWWYNSIILFPAGLLFGKYEKQVTAFLKKGYLFWLVLSFAGAILLFRQSEWFNAHIWNYNNYWGPMKIPRRLACAGFQWLAALFYTAFCLVLTMKVRLGNRALAFLGGITLEFYLMHGIFVELFGYNFLDISKSLIYIRKVPEYTAAVTVCSVAAALLFRLLRKGMTDLVMKTGRSGKAVPAHHESPEVRKQRVGIAWEKGKKWIKLLIPVAAIVLIGWVILPALQPDEHIREMNGVEVRVPEGFTKKISDTRYATWEYKGTDKKVGNLILDADIRDEKGRLLDTVEEAMEAYGWLQEAEYYTNPNGIRMLRGFAEYAGGRERRYYIECPDHMALMCMSENEQFYHPDECEELLQQAADSIRRTH